MNTRLAYLFNRWFDGLATDAEKEELMNLVSAQRDDDHIAELMQDAWEAFAPGNTPLTADGKSDILRQILREGKDTHAEYFIPPKRRWRPYAVAAAVTGLLAMSYFLFFNKEERTKDKTIVAQTTVRDVQPGRDGAVLTLADGKQLVLDSLGNGIVANQTGAAVMLQNGRLVYDAATNTSTAIDHVQTNTMTTPKGRQFTLVLADGSKVWLNAASSITFPTAFMEKERKVSITGEAYFEVAHDAAHPFKVSVNGVEVNVLGTHFNVNAYEDEGAVKTTLLEGSVEVKSEVGSRKSENTRNHHTSDLRPQTSVFLKPGEQAQINGSGAVQVISNANLDEAVGWKSGYFYFEKANVQTVMRQLARWYDIEVVYEGRQTEELFVGKLERNLTLSQVFKILKSIGVKYRVEGKKLYVSS
jgi:transmembrane sensor